MALATLALVNAEHRSPVALVPPGPVAAEAEFVSGSSGPTDLVKIPFGSRSALPPTPNPLFDSAGVVFIETEAAYGSGIVVNQRGYLLTCWHVVQAGGEIQLTSSSGQLGRATLVEHDERLDLAVLLAHEPQRLQLNTAPIASIGSLQLAQEVYAIGAPNKLQFSLTRGIVSYQARPFDALNYLQTDVTTASGSSGGPVFDAAGQVVALSSFVLRDSPGLSFALPIDYAWHRFTRYFSQQAFDTRALDRWGAERALPQ